MRTVCIIEIEELYLLTQNFFQPVLHFIDRIVFPQQNTNTLSGAAVNCCVLTSSLSSLTLLLLPLRCVAGCSTAGVGPLLCTLIYLPIPHARVVSQTDGHSRATTLLHRVHSGRTYSSLFAYKCVVLPALPGWSSELGAWRGAAPLSTIFYGKFSFWCQM